MRSIVKVERKRLLTLGIVIIFLLLFSCYQFIAAIRQLKVMNYGI